MSQIYFGNNFRWGLNDFIDETNGLCSICLPIFWDFTVRSISKLFRRYGIYYRGV